MDRRRMILIVIAVLGVVAIGDLYTSGFGIFEQYGIGFTFRVEGNTPRLSFTLQDEVSASDLERLVIRGDIGNVNVRAGDVESVRVSATVHVSARSDEAAQEYMKSATLKLPVSDRAVEPQIQASDVAGVEGTGVEWQILVPRSMEVDVDARWGSVTVGGVHAPVTIAVLGNIHVGETVGPVRIKGGTGDVSVQHIQGDVTVEASIGTLHVRDIVGNVDVKSSTSEVVIEDISGYVLFSGSMGSMTADRVNGPLRAKQEFGDLRAIDVRGAVNVDMQMGTAYIRPSAVAPITAVVSQGELTIHLPQELASEYRLDLTADKVSIPDSLRALEGRQGGELIDATVRFGTIQVYLAN